MLSENNSRDETVLSVSYLGFVNRQLTVSELKRLNYSILLTSGVFQLNDVKVSNENRTLIRLWPTLMLTRNYKMRDPFKGYAFIENLIILHPY
jgi:hypothetical protein